MKKNGSAPNRSEEPIRRTHHFPACFRDDLTIKARTA